MKKGRHVLKHAECAFRLLLWSSWFIIGIIAAQILISKEHPVAGGGGVSGSRFNVRDG